jgi:hypothetical protein
MRCKRPYRCGDGDDHVRKYGKEEVRKQSFEPFALEGGDNRSALAANEEDRERGSFGTLPSNTDDDGDSDAEAPHNAAGVAHKHAEEYAKENKISLDDAYTKLIKDSPYFRLVMRLAHAKAQAAQ